MTDKLNYTVVLADGDKFCPLSWEMLLGDLSTINQCDLR